MEEMNNMFRRRNRKKQINKKLTVIHARLLKALKGAVEELETQGIKYITVD